MPPLICAKELTNEFVSYVKDLSIPDVTGYPDIAAPASEDFALVAQQIPSTYIYLSAGYEDKRGDYPVHHPKALFNEKVCAIGSACYAACAFRYLADHGSISKE